ncbi:helix-turn-helix transcriptional regulator [Ornithinimicrobium cavernae]|uniref:helix-turn-helix transcriptional regulator n=1 Tax=Ornithinimicrobium cavernae TaxID=2666047 RepID=UPI000D692146|nr:helix-turn-helix transcriptional regulator [Ornithinimicrobium cavernae]
MEHPTAAPDSRTLAREAHRREDWPVASASFAAAGEGALTADDLAAYGGSEFWLGHMGDSMRLCAAAYDAYRAESRPADAAISAVFLGILHLAMGDEPQGTGWIGRAGRLVADLPECAAHGYVLFTTEVVPNLLRGRPAEAATAARRIQDLGRRLGETDLITIGIHSEGRALLRSGQPADGLALMDEAMMSVLDGRLTPFNQWTLYCFTLEACHEVGDVRRMSRWTELTEQWLATRPAASALGPAFGGMCAVHRAQLHLLHGTWDEAERAALVAAQVEGVRLDYAAEAWYVIAESRRLRGVPGAAEAYDEAHSRGRNPQPGRALLRLADGDAEGAHRSVRSALAAAGDDPLRRVPLCAAAVETALAAGRIGDADAAVSELEQTASSWGTSGLRAVATAARGAVLLAEERVVEALPVLTDACRRWQELGAVYDAARTCASLAEAYRALGDEESARAETALAEATYQRLRARRTPSDAPDGLTDRECEVLVQVAEGRSNQQIAEVLSISDRTVARHLTNIFHKICVTSRTQAVRYAIDHGLVTTR